jgi:hypothetical protein
MSTLRDRVRGHFVDPAVLDAEEARETVHAADCTCMAEIGSRTRVRVTGVISSLVIRPSSAPRSVEVELTDGTGTVTLIWLGRDRIAGIVPGTRLVAEGLAVPTGSHLVLYDPSYEIIGMPGEDQ